MDPIELLRACRQVAVVGGFADVEPPALAASEYEAAWAREPMVVRACIDALLCAPFPGDGLEVLMRAGAIHVLFPELASIKDLEDDPASSLHKDVWAHTKQVVSGVPNLLELRWGALLHDVGKSRTRRFDGRKVTFHNHDVVGARMVDDLDSRLGLFHGDAALGGTVKQLVLNHLRPAQYNKSWSDSGVRRLVADMGGPTGFARLMALSRADLTTKNPRKRADCVRRGDELEKRVAAVMAQDSAPKLPKGTMGIVIANRAVPVGPGLNVARAALEAALADGTLPVDRDAAYYATEGLELLLSRGLIRSESDASRAVQAGQRQG
jgi:poly(A) polymerase